VLNLFSRRRLENLALSESDEGSFRRYVEHLRARNMLDFDDLIAATADLLRTQSAVLQTIAGRWDYLLVDEFQDLNPAQYAIIKALGSGHRNIFAVGDDEQSIFSWTGADPTILRAFGTDFGVAPIVLDHNRRCSRQIFETARRLLAANAPLFAQKAIVADRTSTHDVRAVAFTDDEREADWIIEDMIGERKKSAWAWGDYAVLYRTHRVGNALESRLVRAGIPCRLARGRSLKDDPIIGYVVAALQIMRAPDDQVLIEKLARMLLPDALLEDVVRTMKERSSEFLATVQTMARHRPASDPDRAKLWRFVYEVQNLIGLRRMHDDLMAIVAELLAKRVGPYRNILEEHHDELADPLAIPEIRDLAAQIEGALAGRRRVQVPIAGGVGIAVKALLLAGGVTTLELVGPDTGHADALRIEADPHSVFKALQLVHAGGIGEPLVDYVSFDLETTDDDVEACEIVEIGAVRVRGGTVTDEFHTLVKPGRPVSESARKVHGYGEADLADAPRFADAWVPFREFVGDDVLVAHNGVRFDVPVLERMSRGLPDAGDLAFYDSYLLARELLRSSHRLSDLAERFDVPIDRAHHALDDARALAGVFSALTELRIARARKTSLTNLLDWLAIGLALDDTPGPEALAGERALLAKESRIFALGRFSNALEHYSAERELLGDESVPVTDAVIAKLGGKALMERLRTERTADQRYPEAISRLREIADSIPPGSLADNIDAFLERLTLTTSEGADVDRYRVNLLTLHSTKGLEFPCVYVVGVEDYQIPGYYPTVENRRKEIEEARRLLYVGMTRAEDRLVLTRVDARNGSPSGGSRFLDEMDLVPERA
jgi:DNA polymerase III epsilon subunit family exonuclease